MGTTFVTAINPTITESNNNKYPKFILSAKYHLGGGIAGLYVKQYVSAYTGLWLSAIHYLLSVVQDSDAWASDDDRDNIISKYYDKDLCADDVVELIKRISECSGIEASSIFIHEVEVGYCLREEINRHGYASVDDLNRCTGALIEVVNRAKELRHNIVGDDL